MPGNTDYTRQRINLFDYLPDVYRSDTNKALFENLFNRFLTKKESKRVAGYIGKGNPSAVVNRQIQEPTIHRQAYQLQPLVYNKIGSVEHLTSWKDILAAAKRQGIDEDRLSEWLDVSVFNWVPPIDIDKLIHYRDYYWYDENNPASTPQYITIRSRCATATANASFYQRIIDVYGTSVQPIGVIKYNTTDLPSYNIVSIDDTTNTVVVNGNATTNIQPNDNFVISSTNSNDGTYHVVSAVYNLIQNTTTLTLPVGDLSASETLVGKVQLIRYNGFILDGNYQSLFQNGFVFFYKDSTNRNINRSYLKTVSSSYDGDSNTTSVMVETLFNDPTFDGVISLEEMATQSIAARDCQCTGSVGWDILQWDDNPSNPLWEGDYVTLITSISNPSSPPAVGTDNQLWWDTVADILYQYSADIGWKIIWNNFSYVTEATTGKASWDYTEGCGIKTVVPAAEQWIEQNKWLHKSDVPNFSIAKQAKLPIIEYDWDLELNEWTKTTYTWKYREEFFDSWTVTEQSPDLIELIPLNALVNPSTSLSSTYKYVESNPLEVELNEHIVIIDATHGDLTNYFTPGREFMVEGSPDVHVVKFSSYVSPFTTDTTNSPEKQTIVITEASVGYPVDATIQLKPKATKLGDPWEGYNQHWLFVEANAPVAHPHVDEHDRTVIPSTTPDVTSEYTTVYGDYAQEYEITAVSPVSEFILTDNSSVTIRQQALVGSGNVRVYVNGIRQYGTYDELTQAEIEVGSPLDEIHVAGIRFLPGFVPQQFDTVRIEVGEIAYSDVGWGEVPVRIKEDNTSYDPNTDNVIISLVTYHKTEQQKREVQQYPLFDIYNVDGTPAYVANPIFTFATDDTADVNPHIRKRLATDADSQDYIFEQHLLSENGELLAYRDYSNRKNNIWVNTETDEVFVWDGFGWANKQSVVTTNYTNPTTVAHHYIPVAVSLTSPGLPWKCPLEYPKNCAVGSYWYNPEAKTVYVLEVIGGLLYWTPINEGVSFSDSDETLQTIWKGGLNNETYHPVKRDWKARTLEEYQAEQQAYVTNRAIELENTPSVTDPQYQADRDWFNKQSNPLSPTGTWIGDWELPDPFYYNISHDNRQRVTFRQLLTHFTTIIDAQPFIPGYVGKKSDMFHLIPTGDVNYALGGKIKEYGQGLDTFISAITNQLVTPRALYDFAHSQYEKLLAEFIGRFENNYKELLLDTSPTGISNLRENIIGWLSEQHELNDELERVYGDSTTFTDNTGTDDTGIRNWIITLPYLGIVDRTTPVELIDDSLGIRELRHHDGHINDYGLTPSTKDVLAKTLTRIQDPRTLTSQYGVDTYGRVSTNNPPNNLDEFSTSFNTTITNREGVYWYNTTDRTLYRLNIVDVSPTIPSTTIHPVGSLWLDNTPGQEVLKQLTTSGWVTVSGLIPGNVPIRLHNGTNPVDLTTASVSAWQRLDIDSILLDAALNVEEKLFENVPPRTKRFSLEEVENQHPAEFAELMEQMFGRYVTENGVTTPYENSLYDSSNAFTWNYTYSAPGSQYDIVSVNSTNNTVVIEGDVTSSFGSSVVLYIKNSNSNNGTWTVSSIGSIFDGTNTTIYLNEQISDDATGIVYTGSLLPSTTNTGGETGGYWKDLYTKLYNTPYPHLEPWKLQGYESKPDWWDGEYLNTEPDKWGNRRWKYKHGFELTNVSTGTNELNISGDFTELFVNGFTFDIVNSTGNDGNYTTLSSSYNAMSNATTIVVAQPVVDGTADGKIDYRYGMWENIRVGTIPLGTTFPNGVVFQCDDPNDTNTCSSYTLPVYNYFSVNISNDIIVADREYAPDAVFPPYVNLPSEWQTEYTIRSVYQSMFEVVSPGISYTFGIPGPVEYEWRTSSRYNYDRLTVAFMLDPVKTTYYTFGPKFHTIGGLDINERTHKVHSHTNTLFHGDVLNGDVLTLNGTNQWYVNYLRYNGVDASFSDFRTMWTQWNTPMSYQFSSYVDTASLDIGHRTVCVSEFDYNIGVKRSLGVMDYWLSSLFVNYVTVPPKIASRDNDNDWVVQLSTPTTFNSTIEYYDVHNYPFRVNTATNTCEIYTWDVEGVSAFNNTVSLAGDQTQFFRATSTVKTNGNTYTILNSAFDATSNETVLTLVEPVDGIALGDSLMLDYRTLPWNTGDMVVLSSDGYLPAPLESDNINGVYQYFVIVETPTTFKLARTKEQALANQAIDIDSTGRNNHYVGQLVSTFGTSRTTKNWRHYKLDTRNVVALNTPTTIKGLQRVVDIVDGYAALLKEAGWVVNPANDVKDFDNPSRAVSWQTEIERLIDESYKYRDVIRKNTDSFQVTPNITTNNWSFVTTTPDFITGDAVKIITGTNSDVPVPFATGITYYIIRDSINSFRLAVSRADAMNGIGIDVLDATGVTQLWLTNVNTNKNSKHTVELNPFRHTIGFSPTSGIVSDVTTNATLDPYNSQLLADQYNRPLTSDIYQIFREDKLTTVKVQDGVLNDVVRDPLSPNIPYNYLHLSAFHLFVDTYEHVVMFNNNTTEGQLLYDPFVGLNVTKFEAIFDRQPEFTNRPNVGGHYMLSENNLNHKLLQNIEASIEDLRYAYDSYRTDANTEITIQGRKSLGYEGTESYLDLINVNDNSQFAFWRGQIQNKGSLRSVAAYVNSRRFIDARVDEFWAFKIAEFGSAAEKEKVKMWAQPSDIRGEDMKLHFLPPTSTAADENFIPVSLSSTNRWVNQPDQLNTVRDNGGQLLFTLIPTTNKKYEDLEFGVGSPLSSTIRHNMKADRVTITATHSPVTSNTVSVTTQTVNVGYPYVFGGNNIDVYLTEVGSPNVQKKAVIGVDYNEVDDGGLFSSNITIPNFSSVDTVTVVYKDVVLREQTHYSVINSNIVELVYPEAQLLDDFVVWGWHLDHESHTPTVLADVKAGSTITNIELWDPARGHHSSVARSVIDLVNDTDPAVYSDTLSEQVQGNANGMWTTAHIGKTWLDTYMMDYLPYYDSVVYNTTSKQSNDWGKLADWGDIKVKTWVESNVHPSEWNALAESEERDSSMDSRLRKSGRVYKTLFDITGPTPVKVQPTIVHVDPLIEGTETSVAVYEFDVSSQFTVGDVVSIFNNGKFVEETTLTNTVIEISDVDIADRITFVKFPPSTDEEIQQLVDAGTHAYEYQFTTTYTVDEFGEQHYLYYFWVEDKATKWDKAITPQDATVQLKRVPTPFVFFTSPAEPYVSNFSGTALYIPPHYEKGVIKGLRGYINDTNRYSINWMRDYTLRAELGDSLVNKNLHEEWELIRQEQLFNVPRRLWDKITQSIVGYKVVDGNTIRVPSYERELYDIENGTDTRYGLGDDQAFVDGKLALATIMADLTNVSNDFSPTDINVFFEQYSFDTPENIQIAMDRIYNTFAYMHVNRIFFSVLHDAFSTKAKYPDIMKTSMVALHGVRPFQAQGVFDD